MLFHYGSDTEVWDYEFGPHDALGFPGRMALKVVEWTRRIGLPCEQALDIGCSVGGTAFAMARHFDKVVGVDLSRSFINAANTLKQDGSITYFRRDEGELGQSLRAEIDPSIDRDRVTFLQADACALPMELVGFDAVLLSNLLCRLPSPRACLSRMRGTRGLVRPGGLLVLASPYTWMERFTPKGAWLGGFESAGRPVWSKERIAELLADEFQLLCDEDVPLLIREHARKYQYIVAHTTVWRRREANK
jgi:putative 4-mercaptohistidine N1-methyltranferase